MCQTYTMPPYLQKGDKVAIVAPAGRVSDVEKAVQLIITNGYEPFLGNYVKGSWGTLAGTDKERLTDLQAVLDNPDIKAIFCARGGYGITRILEGIDWKNFIKSPKWIVGFSDITALHIFLQNMLRVCSIHACMPVQFDNAEAQTSVQALFDVLAGKKADITLSNHPGNIYANSEGILIGGNLTMLCNQIGTNTIPDIKAAFADKILFLEEVNEPLYHIDRMFVQLYRSGILAQIQGLLIGHFSIKANEPAFGLSLTEIVKEKVAAFCYPVIFGIPAGHEFPNLPLILGSKISIQPNAIVV